MDKYMHHQTPLMSIICVTFGSFTALFTNPTPEIAKAFMLGAVGGIGAYIAKSILDKIVKFIKNDTK
jgi:hypothetical protein